jgi:hypothetical protein
MADIAVEDGVAEPVLGLAEGKTRGLAYVPAIHVFDIHKEARRGCRAGKFAQPAQAWLRARA